MRGALDGRKVAPEVDEENLHPADGLLGEERREAARGALPQRADDHDDGELGIGGGAGRRNGGHGASQRGGILSRTCREAPRPYLIASIGDRRAARIAG